MEIVAILGLGAYGLNVAGVAGCVLLSRLTLNNRAMSDAVCPHSDFCRCWAIQLNWRRLMVPGSIPTTPADSKQSLSISGPV